MRFINGILFLIAYLICTFCSAQVKVDMEKKQGVYYVPCRVNGMPLNFIFDTGASTILISGDAVKQLVTLGLITNEDVEGKEYMQVASGEIMEGIRVRLKSFDIGGIRIKNVEAVVHLNMDAPLLLGTSALERFGNVSIDYSNSLLVLGSGQNEFLDAAAQMYQLHKYLFGASAEVVESLETSEKWRMRLITGSYTDWRGENVRTHEKYLKYKNRVSGLSLGKDYTFDSLGLVSVLIYPLQDGLVDGNPDMSADALPAPKAFEVYQLLDSMMHEESGYTSRLCIGSSPYKCFHSTYSEDVQYNLFFPALKWNVISDSFQSTERNIKDLIRDARSQSVINESDPLFIIIQAPTFTKDGDMSLCLKITDGDAWDIWMVISRTGRF